MPKLHTGSGDVFESGCEMLEMTSLHRPDTSWRVTDVHGHEHRWYEHEQPATSYHPVGKYSVPTLVWVHDDWGYYEDGERYEIGHHECRDCGAPIEPRYCADTNRQYAPGLRWYRINDEPVTEDEFRRRLPNAR